MKSEKLKLDKSTGTEMLYRMLKIRVFEEKIAEMADTGVLYGSAHTGIGEEGVYVGACMALDDEDTMVGTHRSHGHPIAKGADLKRLMAEVHGKVTGVNHGNGGSMHLADATVGSLGETAMVGGGSPTAVGAGLAFKMRKEKRVSVVFFGDGAANEGTTHESMNMASVFKLPVIFVLENNGNVTTHNVKDIHSTQNYAIRAAGYNMPGVCVDGQNVEEVYDAMKAAVARAREGFGPTLLECKTKYFHPHCEGAFLKMLHPLYRDLEELDYYVNHKDPIALFEKKLLESELMTQEEIDAMHEKVVQEVADAYQFALDSPYPELSQLEEFNFSTPIAE